MKKILAIDDEIGFTTTIQNYFSLRGYKVVVANYAADGIEMFKKENPDIVIMDLKMPGMDGDEALKKMIEINPRAKIIMITALQDEGNLSGRLAQLGASAYFEKPLASIRDLAQKIEELAGK